MSCYFASAIVILQQTERERLFSVFETLDSKVFEVAEQFLLWQIRQKFPVPESRKLSSATIVLKRKLPGGTAVHIQYLT